MRHFGLIGQTLAHSFSPEIHALLGDYPYTLYPVAQGGLKDFLATTAPDGFNVTIPYKTEIMPFCDELSERAARIGSVNTVIRKGGRLYGYNTDYDGFSALLGSAQGFQKALILGSGGASKTVQTVLHDRQIPFAVISRRGENHYGNLSRHSDADLIVNTTPVGMYPHNLDRPIDLTQFPACRLVLDLIYNPLKTALLLQAEDLGIACKGGMEMLVSQAAHAACLFDNNTYYVNKIPTVLQAVLQAKRSISLIGMPGCGKTTIGKRLAQASGRAFFDCDEELEAAVGMSASTFLTRFGEAAFRQEETKVLRHLSQKTGIVLATGGGVVTREENRFLLRQNCLCVFLSRDCALLPTDGRPLSKRQGLSALLAARLPQYRAWADLTVENTDTDACVTQILEAAL